MKKIVKSFSFSIEGLRAAWKEERNFRNFVIFHAVLCIVSIVLRIDLISLILLTFVAGFFLVVELLNTSLERLADAFDDREKQKQGGHYHIGVKAAKDMGAAASLIALVLYIALIVLLILPIVIYWFLGGFGV